MIRTRLARLFTSILALIALGSVPPAYAADDPSIQGSLRSDIRASMEHYISHSSIEGVLPHYDPVEGKLLQLSLQELHSGIVKKGDFYVSCADFVDQSGRKVDVDFLVVPRGDALVTVQALVHKVDGTKRPYHVEN